MEKTMRSIFRSIFRGMGLCLATQVLGITGACAGDPARIAPPKRLPEPVPAREQAGDPVSIASLPQELRRAVVGDAARRLRVPESAVALHHATQVTWNDGALGCPAPGQMYTQAIVPGFRIVARTGDRELVYHTDARTHVVLCGGDERVRPGDSEPRIQPPTRTPSDR
jgi:hypothetical protein